MSRFTHAYAARSRDLYELADDRQNDEVSRGAGAKSCALTRSASPFGIASCRTEKVVLAFSFGFQLNGKNGSRLLKKRTLRKDYNNCAPSIW